MVTKEHLTATAIHLGNLIVSGAAGFYSEYIVQTGAIEYALAVKEFGETTVDPLKYPYFRLLEEFGPNIANLTKNHLGDIAYMSFLCSAVGIYWSLKDSDGKSVVSKNKIFNKIVIPLVPALIVTANYLIPELRSSLSPNQIDCISDPFLNCKGDPGDVLSFSIPLVTYLGYLAMTFARGHGFGRLKGDGC